MPDAGDPQVGVCVCVGVCDKPVQAVPSQCDDTRRHVSITQMPRALTVAPHVPGTARSAEWRGRGAWRRGPGSLVTGLKNARRWIFRGFNDADAV